MMWKTERKSLEQKEGYNMEEEEEQEEEEEEEEKEEEEF